MNFTARTNYLRQPAWVARDDENIFFEVMLRPVPPTSHVSLGFYIEHASMQADKQQLYQPDIIKHSFNKGFQWTPHV